MANKYNVLNIAHRGARSLAPENTLVAARKAIAVGADMWELDVNMTKDGELVILHDDTLERTSNVRGIFPDRAPWKVSDFTSEELLRLDFGSWYIEQDPFGQIAAGAISQGEQEHFTDVKIPILRQALEFTKEFRFRVNVEIKDLTGLPGDADVVRKVVQMIDELSMFRSVLLSSFNHEYLRQAEAINPMIETAALIEQPVENPAALLDHLEAQALNPDKDLVTPEMVHNLRDGDYDVYVWTVNDEAEMRKLIQEGVSGIITDFPQVLFKVLNS